jgi:hypothetical protein
MHEYLLSIYQPDGGQPEPAALAAIMRDVAAVADEMRAAGAWVFSAGLHPPSTSTVVRMGNGRAVYTDGPFCETKEHLGGFTIIRAANLDAALAWGTKLSKATTLPIEVRPMREIA